MFNKVYSCYSLFVAGWCLCNIIWLVNGGESSILQSIITILLVTIQIGAPIVNMIYKTMKG